MTINRIIVAQETLEQLVSAVDKACKVLDNCSACGLCLKREIKGKVQPFYQTEFVFYSAKECANFVHDMCHVFAYIGYLLRRHSDHVSTPALTARDFLREVGVFSDDFKSQVKSIWGDNWARL